MNDHKFHGIDITNTMHSVISHRLRRLQVTSNRPVRVVYSLDPNDNMFAFLDNFQVSLSDRLPSPAEQADQLIIWVGDRQASPAGPVELQPASMCSLSAWIGAAIYKNSDGGLIWLLSRDEVKSYIDVSRLSAPLHLSLTMRGWERYDVLKTMEVTSRLAFMAMQFDRDLFEVVENCFKPAVSRAGFELRLLTDGQAAGLIDDQLRVALRNSRFTIADLTHGNNGAYWEAGFAEGLGRPVIYTCRKGDWDKRDESGRTNVHFDTNHLVTIIWEPDRLDEAAARLTATIRATLPGEARMFD